MPRRTCEHTCNKDKLANTHTNTLSKFSSLYRAIAINYLDTILKHLLLPHTHTHTHTHTQPWGVTTLSCAPSHQQSILHKHKIYMWSWIGLIAVLNVGSSVCRWLIPTACMWIYGHMKTVWIEDVGFRSKWVCEMISKTTNWLYQRT